MYCYKFGLIVHVWFISDGLNQPNHEPNLRHLNLGRFENKAMSTLQWEKLSPQEFQQLQDLAECKYEFIVLFTFSGN